MASEELHQSRITHCPECGTATEHRKVSAPGLRDLLTRLGVAVEYDWCPQCRGGLVCACEGCEVLRALARL